MDDKEFQELINNMDAPNYSHVNIENLKILTREQIMAFDPKTETTERLEAFHFWLCTEYKGPVPKSIELELNLRDLFESLDKQKFNKTELLDEEYIAEKISHWGDYGGISYKEHQCLELANEYIKRKQ